MIIVTAFEKSAAAVATSNEEDAIGGEGGNACDTEGDGSN